MQLRILNRRAFAFIMLGAGLLPVGGTLIAQVQIAARSLTEIDRAFERLYNYDFAGAQTLVDQYIAKHPGEALPYNVRAAGLLFQELGRLQILESEFFSDDDRVGGKKKSPPDPALRAKLFQALDEAKKLGEQRVAKEPKNPDALFQMSFNAGLRSDYVSLIEKKYISSFGYIKEATRWAVQCLQVDPNYGDAYLTTGMTEYIIGSVSPWIRWAVKFDNVKGSKDKAKDNLAKVVRTGRYLGPFAKIMLALANLRDKQPQISVNLLSELARDYPDNRLIKTELEKIRGEMQSGRLR